MIIASVADFCALAKRRLPKFVFDYMDGGAGKRVISRPQIVISV